MSNVYRFPGVQLPPPPSEDHELRAEIRRRLAAVIAVMGTSPSEEDMERVVYQMKKSFVAIECIRVLRALP